MSMNFKDTINGSVSGNAGTATKLAAARTINGTSFDGSANITTANWGAARNIYIADSSAANTGTAISVNGSGNVTLKLPATISATLSGKATSAGSADQATKLSTARNIQIGNKTNSFNGTGNISYTIDDIGAAKGQFKTATTAATAQWYRIAQTESGINRVACLFFIESSISGKHSITTLSVGVNYGINPYVQQLSHSAYSTTGISKARIVYHTDWSGKYAYLEVYQAAATAATMNVRLLEGVGWTLIAPSTVGSIPSGYTNKAIDLVNNSIVSNVKGSLSGNASTATKLQTKRTITIGNQGVDFDGSANISFNLGTIGAATSGHNHDSTYSKTNHTHNYAGSSSAGGVATSAAKLATPVTLTIGAKGKTFDGSANQSWSLSEIGAAASSHNHTSLTGITSLAFKAENSDAGSISTVIDSSNTYFDFNLSDDASANDMWRWRFSPSGGAVFNAMTLDPTSSTAAKLTVAGEVTATSFTENGTTLSNKYAAKSHGTHVGDAYATVAPKANGTAAIGKSSRIAREDHVHPLQTTVSGNAGTATKLQTARSINGTLFDGSGNITTANWGSSRNISISDSDGTNTGTAVSVNGSANATLKLPATIKASLSGNAATATSAGKWTTARTLTIGNKGQSVNGSGNVSWSLADIGAVETVAWDASIKCATWSRLFQYSAASAVIGGAFLVNIQATRGNVVYGPTILVNFGHSSTCNIVQINNISYSDIKIRGVVDDNGAGYLEIYDNANGATNSTTQGVTVSVTKLTKGLSITKYTAFTNGTTIPTGYASKGEITTVSGCYYTGKAATSGNADTAAKAGKWSTARTLTIGNKGKSVDGSDNVH